MKTKSENESGYKISVLSDAKNWKFLDFAFKRKTENFDLVIVCKIEKLPDFN